ncbi:MAG: T9SS type A sorting domain-containing protein [Bacteroidales bacterium]|nr:T9SS type A sorting domain-containing protein [Bacteroidales bacterium]
MKSLNFNYRNIVILFTWFVVGNFLLKGQPIEWRSIHPIAGADDDYINDVVVYAQDNVVVGGRYKSTSLNFEGVSVSTTNNGSSPFYLTDVFIAQYDANGLIKWAISGGGRYGDNLTALAVDNDGNIYFSGTFASDTFMLDTVTLIKKAPSVQDVFFGKLNSQGKLQWLKSFGASDLTYVRRICLDNNGNIYIVGDYSGDSIVVQDLVAHTSGIYGGDIYLIKANPEGKAIKVKSIGGVSSEYASCIKWQNGTLVLAGISYSGDFYIDGKLVKSYGEWDCFIAYFDANLGCTMVKSFGGRQSEEIKDIDLYTNGDLAVVGSFRSDTLRVEGTELINQTSGTTPRQDDIFVVRYDNTGKLLLARSYGELPNDIASTVLFSKTGDIYIGGYMVSAELAFGSIKINHSQPGSGYTDYFLVRLNNTGNAIWGTSFGSNRDDENLLIRQNSAGKFIVTGNYRGTNLNAGNMILVNSGEPGSYEPFLGFFDEIVEIKKLNNDIFSIYPNPASSFIYLKNVPSNVEKIVLVDLYGRLIHSQNYYGLPIDVSMFQPGIYWVKLFEKNTVCVSKPFVKY